MTANNIIISKTIIYEIPQVTYELNDGKKKPLLFFFHGFTGNKDMLMGRGEILAEMGFYVVAIDAHFHGDRMPDWFGKLDGSEKYKHIIDISIKTANDANKLWDSYYSKQKNISEQKFYVYGVSMGAMIAFKLSTITEKIKAMVTLVGSPSFVDYYLARQEKFGWEDDFVEEKIKKYKPIDPLINYKKTNNTNMFIALGKDDDVVDPFYALEFYNKRPENTTLKLYDTGHMSTKEMLEDSYNYLKKHSKTRNKS